MKSGTRRRTLIGVVLALALVMVASLFAPALSSQQSFASVDGSGLAAQKGKTSPPPSTSSQKSKGDAPGANLVGPTTANGQSVPTVGEVVERLEVLLRAVRPQLLP